MRISLPCVHWLSVNMACAGYVEEEEVFMPRANTESGFGQYLCPFPPSLLFALVTVRARGPGVGCEGVPGI